MIAASDFPSDVRRCVVNIDAPAAATTADDVASFAQSLGNSLRIAGGPPDKSTVTADAALLHTGLGLPDPQSLQAEVGILFGVRPVVLASP